MYIEKNVIVFDWLYVTPKRSNGEDEIMVVLWYEIIQYENEMKVLDKKTQYTSKKVLQ